MSYQEQSRRKKSSKKKNSYKIQEQTEIKYPYPNNPFEEITSTYYNNVNRNMPDEYQRNIFPDSTASEFYSDIDGGIRAYDQSMNEFQREYPLWSRKRQETLLKLGDLVSELHTDQLSFNQTKLVCKEFNVMSRQMKTNDDSPGDFFASLGAFVTDAIGGINSIAQACNVDKYMKRFGEITEDDAEHTKKLYAVKSKCVTSYENVEEIIKRYHVDTFGSTLSKISKSLNTAGMWLDLKTASNGNNLTRAVEKVDEFFRQVSTVRLLNEVSHSFGHYIDSNPAVLEACEAAGKTLYGALDTWGRDHKSRQKSSDRRISKNSGGTVVSSQISSAVNSALILREDSEIRRLREMLADEDEPQAKLESKINEAIEDFEAEAREMKKLYDSSMRCPKKLPNNDYMSYSEYY